MNNNMHTHRKKFENYNYNNFIDALENKSDGSETNNFDEAET